MELIPFMVFFMLAMTNLAIAFDPTREDGFMAKGLVSIFTVFAGMDIILAIFFGVF
jgi:hypothetical protein